MNLDEYKKYIKNKPSENKYGAVKKEYKGRMYHSSKEADYARDLDLLLLTGEVIAIFPQVTYKLEVNQVVICKYILDFKIQYKDGHFEYHDVKGYKEGTAYQMFKLKKKLMKAIHGIDIVEI